MITNKINDYYLDDFGGVWNSKLNWVGSYVNNTIYLLVDIKKKIRTIKNNVKK